MTDTTNTQEASVNPTQEVAPKNDYITEDADTIAADIAAEEAQSTENPEAQKETPKEETEQPKEPSEKKPRPGKVERELAEERQRNADLEARLQKLEGKTSDIKSSEGKELTPPNIADFDNVLDYYDALRAFDKEELRRELKAERTQETEANKRAQNFQQKANEFAIREAKIIAENPDYTKNLVELAENGFINEQMVEAFYDSPIGEKISLHLSQNPDEAEMISQLEGKDLYRVIGMLEAKLASNTTEKTAAVRTTKTPPPITPVKANSASTKDQGEMEYDDYLVARAARRKARGLH